jgi:hypothetical protein
LHANLACSNILISSSNSFLRASKAKFFYASLSLNITCNLPRLKNEIIKNFSYFASSLLSARYVTHANSDDAIIDSPMLTANAPNLSVSVLNVNGPELPRL